jgi:hypothetical protein
MSNVMDWLLEQDLGNPGVRYSALTDRFRPSWPSSTRKATGCSQGRDTTPNTVAPSGP